MRTGKSVFDPFAGMEVCAWHDEYDYVEKYHAIGGGSDPVHICGLCIQKYGHLYEPYDAEPLTSI